MPPVYFKINMFDSDVFTMAIATLIASENKSEYITYNLESHRKIVFFFLFVFGVDFPALAENSSFTQSSDHYFLATKLLHYYMFSSVQSITDRFCAGTPLNIEGVLIICSKI
jgi:hypothetical protein